jgi:hypothetical protein
MLHLTEAGPSRVTRQVLGVWRLISFSDGVIEPAAHMIVRVATGDSLSSNFPSPRQFTAAQTIPGFTSISQDFGEDPVPSARSRSRVPGFGSGVGSAAIDEAVPVGLPDPDVVTGDVVAAASERLVDFGDVALPVHATVNSRTAPAVIAAVMRGRTERLLSQPAQMRQPT